MVCCICVASVCNGWHSKRFIRVHTDILEIKYSSIGPFLSQTSASLNTGLFWCWCTGHLSIWSPLRTKALTVCGWTASRTTGRLATTQSSSRRCAYRLLSFHRNYVAALQLIEESWPERGEECLEAGWRAGAGSGRWSFIRDWTISNLPAASAQHRDHRGGRSTE